MLRIAAFLMSLGTEFHIVAPKYLNVFFPFKTVINFGIILFLRAKSS